MSVLDPKEEAEIGSPVWERMILTMSHDLDAASVDHSKKFWKFYICMIGTVKCLFFVSFISFYLYGLKKVYKVMIFLLQSNSTVYSNDNPEKLIQAVRCRRKIAILNILNRDISCIEYHEYRHCGIVASPIFLDIEIYLLIHLYFLVMLNFITMQFYYFVQKDNKNPLYLQYACMLRKFSVVLKLRILPLILTICESFFF